MRTAQAIAAVTDAMGSAVARAFAQDTSADVRDMRARMPSATELGSDESVGEAFDALPEDFGKGFAGRIGDSCNEDGWPESLRRCVVAASSFDSALACR